MTTTQQYIPEHIVVSAAQYHCGRAETYRAEIQKLNKAIERKNRRLRRQGKKLSVAQALLDFHGIDR